MAETEYTKGRPRVVIVGAGFGGVYAAKALRKAPVEVVIVDRNNYHRFQPLLYEVAIAGLEPDEIAHNVRELFRRYDHIHFRLGTVADVDTDEKVVHLRSGPPVGYDYLILAAGAVTNYFGVEGAKEHAYPLKSLPDAINLRNHILRQFERYDREDGDAPPGTLSFVIVGGGPTGVETAGALVELFNVLQGDYPRFDTRQATVYLLEMLPHLLAPYADPLRRYTYDVLERRGVQVMTDATVERVTADAVDLDDGRSIPTRTLIWAAGVQANPLAGRLGMEQGKGGRVLVGADLSVPGYPDVFVIGDMAAVRGNEHPQLAPVAIQQAEYVARLIRRRLEGKEVEPFAYEDPGQMATIGRNAAVVEFAGGRTMKGFVAWVLWVFLHIAKLIGFRNRANVFINWVYNYLTYDRSARLILDVVPISEGIPEEVEVIDERLKAQMDVLESELANG